MHMTSLMGYARTMLHGGEYRPEPVETFADEITRFHAMVGSLRDDFDDASLGARITDKQFLQGPMSDAMTHAGQLAMLRRLAGSPVASENFIFAKIDSTIRANNRRSRPRPMNRGSLICLRDRLNNCHLRLPAWSRGRSSRRLWATPDAANCPKPQAGTPKASSR